jgi:hypothetical protein
MDIVSVYKQLDGKDMLIYLSESNELFSSQRYQGYLRNTETSYFFDPKMISRQMERNTYKLVLLFSKTTCDKDVRNTIANLLMDVPQSGIVSIKPLKSYPDSWDNIKKELNKDSAYINYRVVVVDLETEEILVMNNCCFTYNGNLFNYGATNPSSLFAQTGNSTVVSGTNVERTLINGGVGTLTVPANAFKIGDSFRAIFGGVMNAANNQTIRIRVKTNGVILLDSGVQNLTSSIVNDIFSLNIDFTIRQIGGAGVASIVSLGTFHYTKINNASTQGFGFNVINNTTFNTTVNNTLDVTVQWGSTNAGNSIYSDLFILNKTY